MTKVQQSYMFRPIFLFDYTQIDHLIAVLSANLQNISVPGGS